MVEVSIEGDRVRQRTIVLELDHEHYKRLVIEVEDPAAVVAMLQRAR